MKNGDTEGERLFLKSKCLVTITQEPYKYRLAGSLGLLSQISKIESDPYISGIRMDKHSIHVGVGKNRGEGHTEHINACPDMLFNGWPKINRVGNGHPWGEQPFYVIFRSL